MRKQYVKSDDVKFEIIRFLRDRKWHSYYEIHSNLGINYESLKKHLNFLQKLGFVELIIIPAKESGSGKGSYKAKITDKGLEWIK